MKTTDELLTAMVKAGGSDLHLRVGLPAMVRIHGQMKVLVDGSIPAAEMDTLLQRTCGLDRWDLFQTKRDLDFAYEISGVARFRANYFIDDCGYGAVFRTIPSRVLSLDELNCPPVFHDICNFKDGIIFVTGPTGSGKSTTLAALVDHINQNSDMHIITLEDPIEFVHQSKRSVVVHREIGQHSISFADALRGAMRSDPDIILVGEMRDLETIRLALSCAAMGVLVFATLHTNSAPKTIDRVIDVFPAGEQTQIRTLLAEALSAVISQQLCQTADGKGRVAVHEILLRTSGLPNMIRESQVSSIKSLIETSTGLGMTTIDGNLRKLLREEIITPLEAYLKAADKNEFKKYLPRQTVIS